MPRRFINLGHLPLRHQNLIAVAIIVLLCTLAWLVGRYAPIPLWIANKLIPALGWIAIGLVAFGLAARGLARRG